MSDYLEYVFAEVKAARLTAAQGVELLCAHDRLGDPSGPAPASAAPGMTLLAPVWEAVEPDAATPAAPAAHARTLVIGAQPAQLAAVQAVYRAAKALALPPDADSEAIARCLLAAGEFEHIVFTAPGLDADQASGEHFIEAQHQGVYRLFRLLQALERCGRADAALALTVITCQSQGVGDEAVDPSHAALQGLVTVLARERPRWSVRAVDLEAGRVWPFADIVRIDTRRSLNLGLAHRGGQWLRRRLVPFTCEAEGAAPFRQGGVYILVGGAGHVGRAICAYLITRYQAQVIWIGRRVCTPEITQAIDALARLGPAPRYYAADVADPLQLDAVRRAVVAAHGPVHGLVHAAMVISDQALATISEEDFRATIASKVDVSVRLAQVFGGDRLDFVLFFSSIAALVKNPQAGYGHYAAGCGFKDAYARYLARHWSCPVKVMNWGYWSAPNAAQLAAMGLGEISAAEGAQALEALMRGGLDQLACIHFNGPITLEAVLPGQRMAGQPAQRLFGTAPAVAVREATAALAAEVDQRGAVQEPLLARLLWLQLRSAFPDLTGEFGAADFSARGLLPAYASWIGHSLEWMGKHGALERSGDGWRAVGASGDDAWVEWTRHRATQTQQAATHLVETSLRALPDILLGQRAATEVIFPDSSMTLVENVYRNNAVSDHFNECLADALLTLMRRRLEAQPQARFRLLEVGAGTGGTSAVVLRRLAPLRDCIDEYCYTDISKAFLMHATRTFLSDSPFLTTRLLNVELPLSGQQVAEGAYDIVIGTNVLHATGDIRRSLRHVKAALKSGGVLLLNEISDSSLFMHLVFGLLEGWWAPRDPQLRIDGCPGLTPAMWNACLQLEGFHHTAFPAAQAHRLGQQIVLAHSDGAVRHDDAAPLPSTPPAASTPRVRSGAPALAPGFDLEHIKRVIREQLAVSLEVVQDQIEDSVSFSDYGVDSITGVQLVRVINARLNTTLPTVCVFDHSSVQRLAAHILTLAPRPGSAPVSAPVSAPSSPPAEPLAPASCASPAQANDVPPPPPPPPGHEPIAIIGMSGRFPGARSVDAMWRILAAGEEVVQSVPPERAVTWDIGDARCGFLPGAAEFDPLFFEISPREAETMDPRQRLLLQEAWNALENAGFGDSQLRANRVGMFVGVEDGDYQLLTRETGGLTSNHNGILASRLAYFLGTHGPTMAINTACASGLVAAHQACQSLRHGECDVALVAGVALMATSAPYLLMQEAGMLSASGQCRAFDEGADGMVPGEAVAVLVCKRLSQAQADGDPIHAVILGSGINYDGKTNGITAPSGLSQAALIESVYQEFGIDPLRIEHMVAHGTGTKLGDPIEVRALREAFGRYGVPAGQCALTSTKPTFGHCLAASGLVSLIGLVQGLRHGSIPPSLHCGSESSFIDWEGSPFAVNKTLRAWPTQAGRERVGAVSAFGMSGTNAHMVVAQCVAPPAVPCGAPWHLLALSGKTEQALRERAAQLLDLFENVGGDGLALASVCHTLLVGRHHFNHRWTAVVADLADAVRALRALCARVEAADCLRGCVERQFASVAAVREQAQELIALSARSWPDAARCRALLSEVAQFHRQGYALNWDGLYGSAQPRRVSLPGYPFAKEEYWLPLPRGAQGGAAVLHPLLHANTSDLEEQRYSTLLSGQEHFLAGHLMGEVAVLPAAALLEMAGEAARRAIGGDGQVQLSGIEFAQPLAARAGMALHVALALADGGAVSYEIYSGEQDTQMLHGRGHARLVAVSERAALPLASLRSRCAQAVPVDECYRRLQAAGVAHGPGMRALTAIAIGQDEHGRAIAVASLALPDGAFDGEQPYFMHPGLLESSLLACVALVPGDAAAPQPVAIARLLARRRLPAQAYAVLRSAVDGAAGTVDIDICDELGEVCVELRGVARGAEAQATTLLMQPAWRCEPAVAGPAPHAHLVLLCALDGIDAQQVQAAMPGARVLRVAADAMPDQAYQRSAQCLLEELKALLQGGLTQAALVQVAVPAHGPAQVLAGLAGLLKSAKLENPKLLGQLLSLQDTSAPDLAAILLANAGSGAQHIRYRDGQRFIAGWEEVAAPSPVRPWRDEGVYLITGGTGGLGLIFAAEIARKVKRPTLVLTARSALNEAQRGHMRELVALGARVEFKQVDVSARDQVDALIAAIRSECGDLNGIVHSAGVLRDSFIIKKSAADLAQVFAPKVTGLINLDQASRDCALDCFVLFSSTSAALGNVGQADYAAANAFMDAYAHYRNEECAAGRRQGRTLSLNWPLWADGGMRVDGATLNRLRQELGMRAMDVASGAEGLYRAWASGAGQLLVIQGDAPRLRAAFAASGARPDAAHVAVAAPAYDAGQLAAKTVAKLTILFARVFKLGAERIDVEEPLESYGIDSITITHLNSALGEVFAGLSKTLLYEYQTLQALANYLIGGHAADCLRWTGAEAAPAALVADAAAPAPDTGPAWQRAGKRRAPAGAEPARVERGPIAIIGAAGRYPDAADLDQFWQNLSSGRDSVTEIPPERWDHGAYFEAGQPRFGKAYSKWGAFVDGAYDFDPMFFNITPREVLNMDPHERLFMQACWALFEDAGYTRAVLADKFGGRVGVFAGVTKTGFDLYGPALWRQGEELFPHTSFGSVANRVSYLMNFHGPSMPIDTMCSASLTAVHEACEHLYRGECEMAVAGGVNLYLHPSNYVGLCAQRMLSAGGKCRSFGEGGDGFVPGEGVGAVLLKPLATAIADGDNVLAVIRGTSINHGGKTNGYMVPSPVEQGKLVRAALDRAGVNARAVSYIEAHGTGTELGDPIEISGLAQAFGSDTGARQYCAIGSVKTNIGHLEAAAGIAGLTKVLLQMRHGLLAPSLHSAALNPHIDFGATPFTVQQTLAPWERPLLVEDGQPRQYPRIAGISSFGAGGANAHVVVEEYVAPAPPPARHAAPVCVVLSAKTDDALRGRARQLLAWVGDGAQRDVHDVAYTLQVGREAMEERLALLVDSTQQLCERLRAFLDGDSAVEQVYRGQVKRNKEMLSLFSADDDIGLTVDAWLAKGKFGRLLDLWVKGLSFDWNRLYGETKPRRVNLPTYPFAKERYWLPPEQAAGQAVAVGGAAAALHPLVHANTSDLSEQRYSTTLTGQEYYLADHLVQGRRVLPGVAQLEMARAAVALALGRHADGAHVELSDIVFARPVVVEAELLLHIALQEQGDGSVSFEIYSDQEDQALVHSQGRARLADPGAPAPLALPDLQSQCARALPVETCYALYDGMGLRYGSAMRAMREVRSGADADGRLAVLARLTLPPQAEPGAQQFMLNPSLLDASLQASIGLMSESDGGAKPALPFALELVRTHRAIPREAFVLVRVNPRSSDQVRKLDITVCDEHGQVCVELVGFTSRVMETESEVSTLLFAPQWTDEAAPHAGAAPAQHWVLLGAAHERQAEIEARLPGARCVRLGAAGAELVQRYGECAAQLLGQIKDILRARPPGQVLVQLVVDASGEAAVLQGLAGMLKSAAKESGKLVVQVVLVEALEHALLAGRLEAERAGMAQEIRYIDGRRQALHLVEAPLREGVHPWKDGGVYLITGGTGGLGLIFADQIARSVKGPTLVLTARSALSVAQRATLDALAALGATVRFAQVDVSDREPVQALIDTIRAEHGGLHGIVHSAGVLRDGFVLKKDAAELAQVLAPKVAGLVNLDNASRACELDCFLLFSSTSAVLGNVGQSDYAAANAFMDAFARHRNVLAASGQRHGRTLSLNWPLWSGGGMQVDAATRHTLWQNFGMRPMESASGVAALYRAWAHGGDQLLVVEGDAKRLRRVAAVSVPAAVAPATPVVQGDRAAGQLDDKALAYFHKLLAAAMKLPSQRVEVDAALEEYGIDSIMVMELTSELEKPFGPLSKTLFYEYQTIRALSVYFVASHAAQLEGLLGSDEPRPITVAAPAQATVSQQPGVRGGRRPFGRQAAAKSAQSGFAVAVEGDIAVIGLAGRYPQADNVQAYWRNLREGRDCITEIPATRWDHSKYFDPNKGQAGKTYAKWGGFIDGVDEFDPLFFGISPREAEIMDPQERLFLQCAYEAIEDAGYTREALARGQGVGHANVGVFAGVMYEEYQLYGAQETAQGRPMVLAGNPANIANRVSYFGNFHGPSMAVDTMCSSSLTTLHLACQSLRRGECSVAIAGGVNVSIHPNKYLMLGMGRFTSSKGQCESFGEGGDGYVPGEGVGAVLLKPLHQAVADGDHIYGVIKASAINHGGKTNGYTVPNPNAQAQVIAQALKESGVPARAVSYIEAHGTGTALGDPIEIAGLNAAFSAQTAERQYCAIGSAKSNIGHCESAAGIAGLTKVLLQMRHQQIVPSLHSATLNPHIDFAATPFVVQQTLAPWERPVLEQDGERREYPRIAGISSFGAGGANAHVVIEEYVAPTRVQAETGPALVVLSARTETALRDRARQLLEALEDEACADLHDLAYTLQVGREAMDERLALQVRDLGELRGRLTAYLAGGAEIDGVYLGQVKRNKEMVSVFAADEDMNHTLAAWLAKGKFGKVLDLWVKGLVFDWNALYGDIKPKRVSLPTYPFAKERYWLPPMDKGPLSGAAVAVAQTVLHPLLHTNTSSLHEQRYTTVFTGSEYFLADHLVQGRRVLPGVAQLEMAREAVLRGMELASGSSQVELRDIVFVRPLVVEDELAVHVALQVEADESVSFELYSEQAGEVELYSQGRALVTAAAEPANIDLASVRSFCAPALSRDDCYQRFGAMGLVYGPAM
ncbi:MAG: SDR family NAD(P)-dependent oxidoreductase, partial [Pseudomonadota bacterium]